MCVRARHRERERECVCVFVLVCVCVCESARTIYLAVIEQRVKATTMWYVYVFVEVLSVCARLYV